jgi:hypothetical protein
MAKEIEATPTWKFADRVSAIAKTIPSYPHIMAGDTVHECSRISKELQAALLAQKGIETLYVGAEDARGVLRHNYLLANFNGQTLIIDPTVSQFVPSYSGVFVGTLEEALELPEVANAPGTKWNEVWSENPVAPHREGPPLSSADRDAFRKKWGSTGAILKDYTQQPSVSVRPPSRLAQIKKIFG